MEGRLRPGSCPTLEVLNWGGKKPFWLARVNPARLAWSVVIACLACGLRAYVCVFVCVRVCVFNGCLDIA